MSVLLVLLGQVVCMAFGGGVAMIQSIQVGVYILVDKDFIVQHGFRDIGMNDANN